MSEAAFYYDIVCPYAYMAFKFLSNAGVFKNNKLELKPILLGGLFKHMNSDVDPNKNMSPSKLSYLKDDIARKAEYFSVPLQFHKRHPVKTVSAMRLIHATSGALREQLTERLYRAYWQENLDIDEESVIDALADEFGLGGRPLWLEKAKADLMLATKEAFEQKVFGVPTIELNQRLYFGSDRLAFIAKDLGLKLPDAPWQPSGEVIDFYFDFSSPYSYLAWAEVKKAQIAGVRFNLIPILLGALFKDVGTVNIPLLSAHTNKIEYYFQDMRDWAAQRDVPFQFSAHFPLRSVTALRVALVEPHAINALFSAAWAYNQNLSDMDVLSEILAQAGFDAQKLLLATQDDAIKAKLKENTEQAFKRGVFGVPSFFVGGQLFFGQDQFSRMRLNLSRLSKQAS